MTDWNYTVQIEGIDFNQRVLKGNVDQPDRIVQFHHYESLKAAMEAILSINIQQLHKGNVFSHNYGTYISKANLMADNETIVSQECVSFDEAFENMPIPAIYLNVMNDAIAEMEQRSNIDFSRFLEFDKDVPHLILGKLLYKEGTELINTTSYNEYCRILTARFNEPRQYTDEDWRYRLKINYVNLDESSFPHGCRTPPHGIDH